MDRIEFDTNKLLGLRVCVGEDKDGASNSAELSKLQVPAALGLKEGPPVKIRA